MFSSPRVENVERIVALFNEAGIETRVTNRRAYAGHDYKGPSYSAKQDQSSWPAVWVVRAEDQPRARAILREAGLAPATRFADELAQSRQPKPEKSPGWPGAKLRLTLIGIIAILVALRYFNIY